MLDHPESEGRTWTGFKWNALKIERHLKEVRSRWSWTRRWVKEEHGKAWELGTLPMRAMFIGNRVGSPVLESTGWVSYQRPFLHVIESFQVMFMNTSFTQHVVVLTTLEEHHHEEEPGFTTKDNYHWTQEQEKVPHIYVHKTCFCYIDGFRDKCNSKKTWTHKNCHWNYLILPRLSFW